jgi:uncharacterized protein YraI
MHPAELRMEAFGEPVIRGLVAYWERLLMSKIIKLALIVGIGTVAIAAKQATTPVASNTNVTLSAGPSASISSLEILEMTHGVGLLVETPVDSFM